MVDRLPLNKASRATAHRLQVEAAKRGQITVIPARRTLRTLMHAIRLVLVLLLLLLLLLVLLELLLLLLPMPLHHHLPRPKFKRKCIRPTRALRLPDVWLHRLCSINRSLPRAQDRPDSQQTSRRKSSSIMHHASSQVLVLA